MSFSSRDDAYRWTEANRPQGPCGLVVTVGGFSHLFLLEMDHGRVAMFYLGMRRARGASAIG
jgi:hypothetical protein